MLEFMLVAARSPELTGRITEVLTNWTNKFAKEQDEYRARDGYRLRLEATRLACVHLEKTAKARKDTKLAQSYRDRMREYILERNELSRTKRW